MIIGGVEVGLNRRMLLIAGPCAIESEGHAIDVAGALQTMTARLEIPFVYKSSFDKANRTSSSSYRGPGIDEGLKVLQSVREQLGVPVLTDIHSVSEVEAAASVVDVLQIPAFLCRQTDLVQAAAASGRFVNIKKGQFLAPHDMIHVVEKARQVCSDDRVMVCERGTSFGYNNLVVDMRGLAVMRACDCPVIFDATHSVQLPGAGNGRSGGDRQHVPVLARAALAAGVAGVFMETHEDPARAPSDGPNAWPLQQMASLLETLVAIDDLVKSRSFDEMTIADTDAGQMGTPPAAQLASHQT